MNSMTFEQVALVMNEIQAQATGQKSIAITDTSSFVSVGTTLLKTGMDPIMGAISQVLSRTIFSVRPYSRKFKGLEVSETAFGNHVRKLSIADKPIREDERFLWPVGLDGAPAQEPGSPVIGDGYSVDMYKLNKPDVLQTNFYGNSVFEDFYTMFRDQLTAAFKDPSEMGRFVSMVVQNMSDKLENYRENFARALLANYIGAIRSENNPDRNIHLLTEYNTQTGESYTVEDIYHPDKFPAFMRWALAYVQTVSAKMTERTELFQTVINSKHIIRHTPKADQRFFFYAPYQYQIDANALSVTFNDGKVPALPITETVNFWQSIETPDTVKVKAARVNSSGIEVSEEVTVENVFGILFDREGASYATTQQWSAPTPFNAAGGYSNIFFHETEKMWNDLTEKAVLFTLD